MKKGINKRMIALICALILAFCDVGSVLAENNVTLPAVEDQEGVELPEQDVTEQPDNGTTETPDDGTTGTPDEPEHTHVYVEKVTKEPTTTAKGEKTFTCECGDSYTEEIAALALEAPVITEIRNGADGIVIYWEAVEGATHYRLFRRDISAGEKEYSIPANAMDATTELRADDLPEANISYGYVVKAYNDVSESDYSKEEVNQFVPVPIVTVKGTSAGAEITWNAVKGADSYWVEVKKGESDWNILLQTEGTRAADNFIDYGVDYYYRVQAINGDGYKSGYSEVVQYRCEEVAAPQSVKAVNNGYTQIKLTWDEVPMADGYVIFRSTEEYGSYDTIADVTGTQYIDKKLKTDQKYYYKIVAYDGYEESDFSEIVSATPKVLTPKMNKTVNAAGNYIKVSWTKPAGAHGYYVYRKQGADGTWKQIATVKDPDTTSYKDTTATGRYYYAVKAYKKVNGKTYTSLRANSIQASVLKKAKVSSVKQKGSERAVTVTWEKVSNATGYQVYKKIGKNGSWKLAKTTGKDERTYSCEIPQGTYTYWKVRAIREINDVTVYALFSDSKSFIFATPKFEYSLSTNWGDRETEVTLTIKNTSKGTLRFYSENASLFTEYCDDGERNLYLETSAGKKLTWSEVKAGKTKNFKFKVDGKGVYYYPETIASFMFRYDGLKYLLLTYADSSYYELYLVE